MCVYFLSYKSFTYNICIIFKYYKNKIRDATMAGNKVYCGKMVVGKEFEYTIACKKKWCNAAKVYLLFFFYKSQ